MNELQRVIKNLKFGSDLKDFVEAPDYLISLCEKLIDPNIKKLAVFMDKDVSTSSLIVFLYSVAHLSDGFTTYMKEFADRNLEVGDRVKVLPGKHVYEYAGIVESAPYLMWLNIVGDKFAKRTLPISEIARLEKTDSERPKGKLNTPIEEEDRSAQDIVLGPDVSTYGNLDIFPNICLVLGKTNSLKQSFNNLRVREKSFPVTLPLSEIYPFGAVSYNGQVLSSDVNQTEQSPIIAVSASYERISNASQAPSSPFMQDI